MNRLKLEDFKGLSDDEALVLYLTQERNEIEAAKLSFTVLPFVFDASGFNSRLAKVDAMLSEMSKRLKLPEAGA